MPYNQPKYLAVVQPTLKTKGALFDLEMSFSVKSYKRTVAYETIGSDELVNNNLSDFRQCILKIKCD